MYNVIVSIDMLGTVLIAGGSKSTAPDTAETITFGDSGQVCSLPEEYPMATEWASAAVLQKHGQEYPIICGGAYRQSGIKARDICHFLHYDNDKWTWTKLSKTLAEPRYASASIIAGDTNTLWVTGGINTMTETHLRSTDLVSLPDNAKKLTGDSFTIKPGPNLPLALAKHCMVKLNSSMAMLIGGEISSGSIIAATYFVDIPPGNGGSDRTGDPGPVMKTKRQAHSCGVLKNPGDSNSQVVVVMGGHYKQKLKSTEVLVVGSNQGWTSGPDFPEGNTNMAQVTSMDEKKLLVFGGFGTPTKIHQLHYSMEDGWIWTEMDQELKVERTRSMAMKIPQGFC